MTSVRAAPSRPSLVYKQVIAATHHTRPALLVLTPSHQTHLGVGFAAKHLNTLSIRMAAAE